MFSSNSLEINNQQQISPNNDKKKFEKAVFNNVIINHGNTPKKDSYEYLILLNNRANLPLKNKPYKILQLDENAHILKLKSNDRFFHVYYGHYTQNKEISIINFVSDALLISTHLDKNLLTLSSCLRVTLKASSLLKLNFFLYPCYDLRCYI